MAVRKINNWYWVDFRFEFKRYRKKSPENSRAGAQSYEAVLRQRLARGQPVAPTREKQIKYFGEFSREWFKLHVLSNNKLSVQQTKDSILKRHLLPFFGKKKLDTISVREIELFKMEKQSAGLSNKSINNILGVLNTCLRHAVEWNETDTAPTINWLKTVPPERITLSDVEVETLLSDNEEPVWNGMVLVALKTGMRFGELCALQWSDVDLVKGQITVRHSRTRGVTSTPKNGKIRYLWLAPSARDWLESNTPRIGCVFSVDNGLPTTYSAAKHALNRICKRTGTRRITWHVLRHTFATAMIERHIPLEVVRDFLGHSSVKMTEQYAHVLPASLQQAARVLDAPLHREETAIMGNIWARPLNDDSTTNKLDTDSQPNAAKNTADAVRNN